MCFSGEGYETRARSVVIMLEMALKTLREAGTLLGSFDRKTMNIDDMDWNCTSDYAFALPWDRGLACSTVLVPDYTFWAWPEAGLIPDFKTIARKLNAIHDAGDAEMKMCGWAGDPGMNLQRPWFLDYAKRFPRLFDFVTPTAKVGSGAGRISMEAQAKRWACTIDLPARGFSSRVPLLLHSGRPMLSIERAPFGRYHFTDNVWYAKKMIAGINYLPVTFNFTNIEEAANVALSEQGRNIGAQAKIFAERDLTTEAAIQGLADILKGIAGFAAQGGADMGSPYVEFPR